MSSETIELLFGVEVRVRRFATASGFCAELCFAGADRAMLDAPTRAELEVLIQAVARPAVIARLSQRTGEPGDD